MSARPAPGAAANRPAAATLGSALYECRVLHHRFAPRQHRFVYRLFYFAFDLDEIPTLDARLRLLSVNRANVFALRESDFLPLDEPRWPAPGKGRTASRDRALSGSGEAAAHASTLKARVIRFCAAQGVFLPPDARVVLVALPRVGGFHFNPVSFYFCFDRDGTPRAAIAEVTNTFREVKPYFVPCEGAGVFRLRVPKHFYVSPFSSLEAEFDFTLRAPHAKLAVRIDAHDRGGRVLHSTLTGERRPLTDARLAWFLVKYPAVTLAIVARIHLQALRLWLKRVPHFRKASAPHRQRDLYRPHGSLASPPVP